MALVITEAEKQRKIREFNTYDFIGKLYWSIGEVAEILSENASALRFWESRLSWINVKKNKKGHRTYTHKDINNISMVIFLTRWLGLSEAGIKQARKLGYIDRLTELARQEQRKAIENETKEHGRQ